MSVAETIYKQIRSLDRAAFMAWGAKDFVNISYGLRFKTSGCVKWKGYVYITYDEGRDLYNIVFFSTFRAGKWTEKKRVEGVFVDQLVEVIDSVVG